MAGLVVGGDSRAGQDEASDCTAVIDGPPDGIPDSGFQVPLVEEPRRRPLENKGGIDPRSLAGCCVEVEEDFARCELPGRGRLSAGFRAFDDYSACGPESGLKLAIADSWLIGRRLFLPILEGDLQ